MQIHWGRVAGVMGFTAVALGAFGAHALKDTLIANQRLYTWHRSEEHTS